MVLLKDTLIRGPALVSYLSSIVTSRFSLNNIFLPGENFSLGDLGRRPQFYYLFRSLYGADNRKISALPPDGRFPISLDEKTLLLFKSIREFAGMCSARLSKCVSVISPFGFKIQSRLFSRLSAGF